MAFFSLHPPPPATTEVLEAAAFQITLEKQPDFPQESSPRLGAVLPFPTVLPRVQSLSAKGEEGAMLSSLQSLQHKPFMKMSLTAAISQPLAGTACFCSRKGLKSTDEWLPPAPTLPLSLLI